MITGIALVFLGGLFLAFVLSILWKLTEVHFQDRAKGTVAADIRPISCKNGEHDWRTLAEPYARQCRVKTCGVVMFSRGPHGEIPDGLKEYMEIAAGKTEPLPGDFPHSFKAMIVSGGALIDVICKECDICGKGERDNPKHV